MDIKKIKAEIIKGIEKKGYEIKDFFLSIDGIYRLPESFDFLEDYKIYKDNYDFKVRQYIEVFNNDIVSNPNEYSKEIIQLYLELQEYFNLKSSYLEMFVPFRVENGKIIIDEDKIKKDLIGVNLFTNNMTIAVYTVNKEYMEQMFFEDPILDITDNLRISNCNRLRVKVKFSKDSDLNLSSIELLY